MPATTESQFVLSAGALLTEMSALINIAERNNDAAEQLRECCETLANMAEGLRPKPYLDMLAPPGFIDD